MADCLYVQTSWDFAHRTIIICGFREPTERFTEVLDNNLTNTTSVIANILNRYVFELSVANNQNERLDSIAIEIYSDQMSLIFIQLQHESIG